MKFCSPLRSSVQAPTGGASGSHEGTNALCVGGLIGNCFRKIGLRIAELERRQFAHQHCCLSTSRFDTRSTFSKLQSMCTELACPCVQLPEHSFPGFAT